MKEYGKMDDEAVKILVDAFSNGASDVEACFLANISKQTLYNYQKEHPDFVDRKEAMKDMIKYQAKRLVKEEIEKGNVNQANWYLERKDKEFKPKQDLTSNDETIVISGEQKEKSNQAIASILNGQSNSSNT